MFKNRGSQKLTLFAFDSATNLPKTGDAANLTAYFSAEDSSYAALADTSATEDDATNAPGFYTWDLAQEETDGNKLKYSGKSTTSGVVVVPVVIYTVPPNFTDLAISGGAVTTGGSYAANSVWLDTFNGSAGTTINVNGLDTAPVNTLADALTLRTGFPALTSIHVAISNSITLGATLASCRLWGAGWSLALGGQSVTGCVIEGATVSGTHTGATNVFAGCSVGTGTFAADTFRGCELTGTLTLSSASTYLFEGCEDASTDGLGVIIDFGSAVGATIVHVSDWSGTLTVKNIKAGDYLCIGGEGSLVIDPTCTGGTIKVSGLAVTDGGTSTVTYLPAATVLAADGTLAAVGGSTVTFPTTDARGNAIPDEQQFSWHEVFIRDGGGVNQAFVLGTGTGTARQYNVILGTLTGVSTTSQYRIGRDIRSNVQRWLGNTASTIATNITGSLSGSVGSVTGNVGGNVTGTVASVVGNVGGNVTGSVASVTANVNAVLTSTGLDNISATAPLGLASTFREKILAVWEYMFGKKIEDDNAGTITLCQGTGSTPATTANFTSVGGVTTIDKAA